MNITSFAQRASLFLTLLAAPLAWASQQQVIPAPPQLAATSYVLMDAASGNVLVENNGDQRLPPASLTKLIRVTYNQQGAKPALELGDAWLKRHPNDLAVRSVMAEVNLRGSDFASARRQYEAILKQRPNHAETLNSLANVLMETKDPGAVAMAERAYKADSQNPLLMDTAGWANHLAGNQDRALQLLREARLRAPDVADIRYHLGAVLAKVLACRGHSHIATTE